MEIHPSGNTLGATIEGTDLAQPVSESNFKQILRALGEHGVLCFPEQRVATQDRVAAQQRVATQQPVEVSARPARSRTRRRASKPRRRPSRQRGR